MVLAMKAYLMRYSRNARSNLLDKHSSSISAKSYMKPKVILLLAVSRRLFCFDSLVILDEVLLVVLRFYVHGKYLRSCRDGQLTYPHFSWAGLDLLSG